MAKESEYGGEDTVKTQGVQPREAEGDLTSGQRLRLLYATDPADETSLPDRYSTPVYRQGARARWS